MSKLPLYIFKWKNEIEDPVIHAVLRKKEREDTNDIDLTNNALEIFNLRYAFLPVSVL